MKHATILIFLSALLLLVSGCSRTTQIFTGSDTKHRFEDKIVSGITPLWYANTPERFVLQQRNHSVPVHHFFDTPTHLNIKDHSVNFVIETPAQSSRQYLVDMKSGRHYFNQNLCKEKDHSSKTGVDVKSPPFHIGFIPRIFDQLGGPQKIFVFDDSKVVDFRERFFSARIIGGFVLKECLLGKCTREEEWGARLVLIGVNKTSKKFKNIKSVEDLSPLVDWKEVQSYIRNGFGNIQRGTTFYPSFRVGAMLSSTKVIAYLKDNSIFFTLKKMTTLKKSCYKLYDYIWKEIGKDTPLESKLRKAKSLKEQVQLMSEIKQSKKKLYNHRFAKTFKTHYKNFVKCESLVYAANINDDNKRQGFFSFYSMLNNLYADNYYYDCTRHVWRKRAVTSKLSLENSLNRAFVGCSTRDIDKSFSSGKVLLNNLRLNARKSHRFIDYDNSKFGTHNKLYSWVPISSKRLQCKKGQEYFNKVEVFPRDIIIPPRYFKSLKNNKVIF